MPCGCHARIIVPLCDFAPLETYANVRQALRMRVALAKALDTRSYQLWEICRFEQTAALRPYQEVVSNARLAKPIYTLSLQGWH
jgi:hypothetical protein